MMKITAILSPKSLARISQLRCLSNLAAEKKENLDEKMLAWQIHSYGGLDELKLSKANMPVISRPSDVIVKVDASSVNPIDVAMINGYGSTVLNIMRKAKCLEGRPYSDIEFPLTMGRDFAGTVVSKGHGVDKLKVGDEVWGVIPVDQQGCHANYAMVHSSLVNPRPKNISYIEAASILYAGLTAWSALWYTAGFCVKGFLPSNMYKKVLVLGGSGGVGSIAVQLLKAWKMHVVTTCSTDATDMLQDLGADTVIDYKQADADSKIMLEGPYDYILDCANLGPDQVKSRGYPHSNYITLNSPLLKNIDQQGLLVGSLKNVADLLKHNLPSTEKQSFVKWGFFAPSPYGIDMLQELVEANKIGPVIQEVFPFDALPKAYERVSEGHLRGKIVINMK